MVRDCIKDWPIVRFRWEDTEYAKVMQGGKIYCFNEETNKMKPDDGKPSLAFAWPNFALSVEIPSVDNIIGAWEVQTRAGEGMFAFGTYQSNQWCHATRDGTPETGLYYPDQSNHPNELAGDVALSFIATMCGAGNGRTINHPLFITKPSNEHPCAWCINDNAGHKKDNAKRVKVDMEHKLKTAETDLQRIELEREQLIKYIRFVKSGGN